VWFIGAGLFPVNSTFEKLFKLAILEKFRGFWGELLWETATGLPQLSHNAKASSVPASA
jgi:hypothetical protein